MATESLQAESVRENAEEEFFLYHAYRRAKARYDLAIYADDYSDEEVGVTSAAHIGALTRYLLEPAADFRKLATKLKTFCDEEAWELTRGREIVRQLAADAHWLAYPGERELT